MNPDDDTSELVDALRSDLPDAEQSARIKARLAALATVSAVGLASTSAAASTGVATTATTASVLASAVSRVTALSWSAKVGLATAVSVSAAAGPVLLSRSDERVKTPVTVSGPSASSRERAAPRAPRRDALHASSQAPLPAVAPDAPDAPAALVPREPLGEAGGSRTRAALRPSDGTTLAAPAAAPARRAASPAPTTPESAPLPGAVVPVAAFDAAAEIPAAPAGVRAAPTPVSGTTLAEETALIDRALAALRAGQLAAAEALLLEHQQRFPEGVLLQERARARTKLVELSRERRLAP